MKKIFIVILLIHIVVCVSFAQPKKDNVDFRVLDDSSKIAILLNVNYDRYVGKKIKCLLNNDTIKYFQRHTFSEMQPLILSGVKLWYSDNIIVHVRIKRTKYQKQFNSDSKWDYDLLKKEKISQIWLTWGSDIVKRTKLKENPPAPSIME